METPSPYEVDINELNQIPSMMYSGKYLVEKPITGYKKIICTCNEVSKFWSIFGKSNITKSIKLEMVGTLEIPVDATVIKPLSMDYLGKSLNHRTKLRTDRAILKSVEGGSMFSEMIGCDCHSTHDNNYKYNIGHEHKPEKPFDNDITRDCTSGIHFFLSKKEAKKYPS
jgi:hypothetical protein